MLRGISENPDGTVWTFVNVASPDWKTAWRGIPIPRGRGEVPATWGPPLHTQYQTMIELIDPRARRVVARATTPHVIIAALASGKAAAYSEDTSGVPFISILTVRLRR
jgi:hypothetical protein